MATHGDSHGDEAADGAVGVGDPTYPTEAAAATRARRLNRRLGEAGEPDFFYVAVMGLDGQWRVERRGERESWRQALPRALRRLLAPWRSWWWSS